MGDALGTSRVTRAAPRTWQLTYNNCWDSWRAWPDDVVMDVSSRAQRVDHRKPRRARRYRVVVRTDLPANLIDLISEAHAAVAYALSDARAPECDEESATDPGKL